MTVIYRSCNACDSISQDDGANPDTDRPQLAILLATHNGALWLDEQLQSIFAQTGVDVSVVVSDDASTDSSPQLLAEWSTRARLQVLPHSGRRFGNAHRNFMRLIREAPLDDAEYIAFADQDDIWLPAKLARAVQCLNTLPADAYSSDFTAFWPDGRRQLIRKSQKQRSRDYLFSSPGPGCSFVIPRKVFDRMREWVGVGSEQMQSVSVHDWLIYAYVRTQGLRWYIDDHPNLLYRQHDSNEIGVNAGWRAALSRLHQVRSGAYRRDVLAIAEAVGESSCVVTSLRRLSLTNRIWLIGHVRQFRRRLADCMLLAVFILLMSNRTRS